MNYHKYNVIPLINNDGEYVGTLSNGDLLGFIKNYSDFDIDKGENTKFQDTVRYRSYMALGISFLIEKLLNREMDHNFIPILDNRNKFIGIVKRKTFSNILKSDR